MALPATIYRVGVQLSDVDRNQYQKLQTTVARHPSETAERLVARVLAYACQYDPDLAFTKGICAGDEPDLWIKGPDGRVTTWIEVGQPDPERLLKASRHAAKVILFAYGPARYRWENQHLPRLLAIPNLTIIGIDYDFLQQIVARLQRAINWDLTITEGNLYLSIGEETLESSLTLLAGTIDQE
ncbi:YaeQ family protein [Trichloromonas sp.]|uniref:YaeQ family protein n=1 Tax=Trichloromonas sp. TaxID=3069249 RepID=UPI003D814104